MIASIVIGLLFVALACWIFWDTRIDKNVTFVTYVRQHSIVKRINNYAITLLLVSGILFWSFIIMNFVVIPYENIVLMMALAGFMFWMYQVPVDVVVMLFFICILVLTELIERRKREHIKTQALAEILLTPIVENNKNIGENKL